MKDLIKMAAKELGARGGRKTKKLYGMDYYRRIQLKSAEKRKANKLAKAIQPVENLA